MNKFWEDGNVWIGTYKHGIYIYNKHSKEFKHLTTEDGLTHPEIHSLYKDASGNMWVGSGGGVNLWLADGESFANFNGAEGQQGSLVDRIVEDIHQSKFLTALHHQSMIKQFPLTFVSLNIQVQVPQFFHRVLATLTLIYVLITLFNLYKSKLKAIYFLSTLVTIIVVSQYLLGIIMLKLFVPIHLGLTHQLGSLILLSSLIITKCEVLKRRAINRPSF